MSFTGLYLKLPQSYILHIAMSHTVYIPVTDKLLVCFLLYLTDVIHRVDRYCKHVALTALYIFMTDLIIQPSTKKDKYCG